jgi:hypothetical protein
MVKSAPLIPIATYPRKGTITSIFLTTNTSFAIATYPRKGGEKLRIKKDAEFFFCKP